ncbi:hypothetical protein [Parendozoicomonas sp. Alg238-R29]|uniref:hypothetical protein n=1 Tax=Parendozoicomonas sp. Alg238-R29 TaxID=2993446 RepID=UPI00248EDF37|nr:hypothetical protein [Parendozoicomonas sp. Alg238-R29]
MLNKILKCSERPPQTEPSASTTSATTGSTTTAGGRTATVVTPTTTGTAGMGDYSSIPAAQTTNITINAPGAQQVTVQVHNTQIQYISPPVERVPHPGLSHSSASLPEPSVVSHPPQRSDRPVKNQQLLLTHPPAQNRMTWYTGNATEMANVFETESSISQLVQKLTNKGILTQNDKFKLLRNIPVLTRMNDFTGDTMFSKPEGCMGLFLDVLLDLAKDWETSANPDEQHAYLELLYLLKSLTEKISPSLGRHIKEQKPSIVEFLSARLPRP